MAKKRFFFFESFWEALRDLPDAERLQVYDAMCRHAFDGEDMELELQGTPLLAYRLLAPVLERSVQSGVASSSGGKSGGRGRPKQGE